MKRREFLGYSSIALMASALDSARLASAGENIFLLPDTFPSEGGNPVVPPGKYAKQARGVSVMATSQWLD